jgi:hypothetical protein
MQILRPTKPKKVSKGFTMTTMMKCNLTYFWENDVGSLVRQKRVKIESPAPEGMGGLSFLLFMTIDHHQEKILRLFFCQQSHIATVQSQQPTPQSSGR